MNHQVDLRSDTVTQPTAAMREAMARAEVGDDVLGHDPTVAALESRIAELLGKPAAVFMPSGTMTNQVAVRLHCGRDEAFLCEAGCHIYNYEQGGFAQLSGVVARTISGQHGILQPSQLHGQIPADNDHLVRTSLLALENTHNRGGGTVQPLETIAELCQWARSHGLATHLDGARLFNASAATGVELSNWAEHFDTVSVCFSKGLGAPVGSALVGDDVAMQTARRMRKLFGGGMRQSGTVAAGALYALENHRERLHQDHLHARQLAEAVRETVDLSLDAEPETNIVLVRIDEGAGTAADLVAHLASAGVGSLPFGPQHVRMVTHLNVGASGIDQACKALASFRGAEQLVSR